MWHGIPDQCTGTIARVRSEIAGSICPGSRVRLESMSANTGRAPAATMAPTVAWKLNGG